MTTQTSHISPDGCTEGPFTEAPKANGDSNGEKRFFGMAGVVVEGANLSKTAAEIRRQGGKIGGWKRNPHGLGNAVYELQVHWIKEPELF